MPKQTSQPNHVRTEKSAVKTRRRNGKVARLPKILRDKINLMLLDGLTYPQVIASLGPPGLSLTPDNLSNWHSGGYQDWLAELDRRQDTILRQEAAIDLVSETDGNRIHEAALQLAGTTLCEMLRDFQPAAVKNLFETDLTNYTRLLNALAKISEAEIKCERHRFVVTDRNTNAQTSNRSPHPGISPHTRKRIEQEFKLFPTAPPLPPSAPDPLPTSEGLPAIEPNRT